MDKVFVISNLDSFGYCLLVPRIILFFPCCPLPSKHREEKAVNCAHKLKKVSYNRLTSTFISSNLAPFFFRRFTIQYYFILNCCSNASLHSIFIPVGIRDFLDKYNVRVLKHSERSRTKIWSNQYLHSDRANNLNALQSKQLDSIVNNTCISAVAFKKILSLILMTQSKVLNARRLLFSFLIKKN